jgi:4-hydroxyphenylacetate 3-monooxygenase
MNVVVFTQVDDQQPWAENSLARSVLGFGDTSELGRRAQEAEKASHYAGVRFQPGYARGQDVHEGYIGPRSEEAADRS